MLIQYLTGKHADDFVNLQKKTMSMYAAVLLKETGMHSPKITCSPDHNNETDPYGEAWRGFYMPVAREFSVWIVSASNVGPYGEKAEKILYYTIKPASRPARGTNWSNYKPDL